MISRVDELSTMIKHNINIDFAGQFNHDQNFIIGNAFDNNDATGVSYRNNFPKQFTEGVVFSVSFCPKARGKLARMQRLFISKHLK